MKVQSIAARAFSVLALVLVSQAAVALELGLVAAASNLQFPWAPTTPIAGSTFPATN